MFRGCLCKMNFLCVIFSATPRLVETHLVFVLGNPYDWFSKQKKSINFAGSCLHEENTLDTPHFCTKRPGRNTHHNDWPSRRFTAWQFVDTSFKQRLHHVMSHFPAPRREVLPLSGHHKWSTIIYNSHYFLKTLVHIFAAFLPVKSTCDHDKRVNISIHEYMNRHYSSALCPIPKPS